MHSVPALSTAYFLFFAILGIFIPYFNLYCYHLKFSAVQIGIISAATALMRLASPLLWSHLADHKWSKWKVSLFTSLASALVFFLCLFTGNFLVMLVLITLYGFFRTAIVPLIDAATWEMVETRGGEYGKIRVWGSVGFIAASLAGGWFLDYFSLKTALYFITVLSVILFIDVLQMPRDTEAAATPPKKNRITGILMKPRMFFFVVICLLMQAGHSAYYGFFTIYMEQRGFSRTLTGLSWSFSVLCEIILMTKYKEWFSRTRPQVVLVLSCFAAAWRWWMMAYSDSIVFIFLAQLLHALTFAAFHIASLTYLHKNTPAELRTSGQGYLNGLSYGLGGMVGFVISGFLFDSMGIRNLFLVSSLFSFAGGMLAVLHYFFAPPPEED